MGIEAARTGVGYTRDLASLTLATIHSTSVVNKWVRTAPCAVRTWRTRNMTSWLRFPRQVLSFMPVPLFCCLRQVLSFVLCACAVFFTFFIKLSYRYLIVLHQVKMRVLSIWVSIFNTGVSSTVLKMRRILLVDERRKEVEMSRALPLIDRSILRREWYSMKFINKFLYCGFSLSIIHFLLNHPSGPRFW